MSRLHGTIRRHVARRFQPRADFFQHYVFVNNPACSLHIRLQQSLLSVTPRRQSIVSNHRNTRLPICLHRRSACSWACREEQGTNPQHEHHSKYALSHELPRNTEGRVTHSSVVLTNLLADGDRTDSEIAHFDHPNASHEIRAPKQADITTGRGDLEQVQQKLVEVVVPVDETSEYVSSFFEPPIEHPLHDSRSSISDYAHLSDDLPLRRKVDLSYHNVSKREAAVTPSSSTALNYATSNWFRANSGRRKAVMIYLQHVEPLLRKSFRTVNESQELDQWLMTLSRQIPTSEQSCEIENIAAWSWIFATRNVRLSVMRYTVLADYRRKNSQSALPLFIPLQLLRYGNVDSTSLKALITEIEAGLDHGTCWDTSSGAILLIRLFRHARLVDTSCFVRIAGLVSKVQPIRVKSHQHEVIQRLTHFYNRLLSLVALPVPIHPFLAVDVQQRAQLKIARIMMESSVDIPLNREGYRALARLQLMHRKTIEEQQWSTVKRPSWPPWRRDELGIDAKIEYSGQQSRVQKVIKRMLAAGYGPSSMEQEAQILAGWDTDKSPTIQTRHIIGRRPLEWMKRAFKGRNPPEAEIDHHIWAARVAATRSVREAWMCFYSYMQFTMHQQRELRVYYEMFRKLLARTQTTDPKHLPSPGDGKEVFPDPSSSRDHVYVPEEPFSIDELYAQMLQDGIRPAGRLLATLMDSSKTLRQGLQYIEQSNLGDVKQDLLLHPEKYPENYLKSMYSTLPEYLLASYIGLFMKSNPSDEVQLFWPGSRSVEEEEYRPRGRVKPLHYAMMLLQIWKPKYMPVIHAILEGICSQAQMRQMKTNGTSVRQYSHPELWKMTKHLLDHIDGQRLQPDLICFRKLVIIIRWCMMRAPFRFVDKEGDFVDAIHLTKTVFVKAIEGRTEGKKLHLPAEIIGTGHQPYWKDIENLILISGFERDFNFIIDILQWFSEGHGHLLCVDDGGYKMQRLICAVRVALESTWAGESCEGADEELIMQAREYLKRWGWPDDIDVGEFMQCHWAWFKRMRATIKHSA